MAASSENVLSTLIPLYFDDDSQLECTPTVLSYVEDHQLFALTKPSSLHPIVSHVHNCLNSSNKRLEGLLLLEKLVEQSSTLVFIEYVETWIKLLLQILKNPGETIFHQKCCIILSQLLSASTGFADISRHIASNITGQLLTALLQAPDMYYREAIHCIKVCAESYPGATGSFRSKIEKLVLTDLQRPVPSPDSASCLALIAGCGPGGKNHVKHTEGWTIQFNKIYYTLKHTLSLLYEVLDTDSKPQTNTEMFQLEELPLSTVARQDVLLHRFKVFSHVLSTLLRQPFKSVAKIPVEQILEIICECLAINGKMLLTRASTDHLLLLALLPSVHVHAFSILDSLIVCCRHVLIPFTSTINKLFIQTLVWSRTETKYGQEKQYSQLREKVYDSILTWLKVLGTSTNLVAEETDLTKEIISDITPLVDVLKLSSGGLQGSTEPPKKKKKKNIGYQDITHSMATYRKVNNQANSGLTSTCLQAFQHFILNFGSCLQLKTYKNIQESVVTILLDIQSSGNEQPIPYAEDKCRTGLYQVLKACIISPHAKVPSLLQCSVRLFSIGQNDSSIEVSNICREAMLVCECLIHPRAPCLRGPNIEVSTININSSANNTASSSSTEGSNSRAPTQILSTKTSSLSRSTVFRTSLEPKDHAESEEEVLNESNSDEEMVDTNTSVPGIMEELSNNSEIEKTETTVVKQSGVSKIDLEDSSDTLLEENIVAEAIIIAEKSLVKETAKVVEEKVTIIEEESQDKTIKTIEKTLVSVDVSQSKEVDSMVLAFVDEGPDSD